MTQANEWRSQPPELLARRANSFGAAAESYDAHRPDYPIDAVRWALEPVGERNRVLDIGAGTGKLTGVLLAAGAHVTAVEPDAEMRAVLARRYPEVPTMAGAAESIPLQDASVDAVLTGQAFHWFDQARAFPEFARVLRPGGVVAAFWNSPDTSIEWIAELNRVARSSVSTARGMDDSLVGHPLFHTPNRAEFPHMQRRTAESLTTTIGTHSHTLVLPRAERAEVLDRIAAYLAGHPETAGGEFDFPLRTKVIRVVLR
ncbi:class I SAM-dependent methyltransferase [Nocardia otitidiscaviarum]|uniref:class I SAM-dependent methyltransferase n=1 Tax=Nocardia otitidiscaviarum TaxID=1823 RepID=UPI0018935632|nr:class I SAM-dependent methyltransferase [Nocardia otitidiscaviarum]MBF6180761.1 methyltransferase domain-containing protein [Nocardia otitidiscaviarum]